MQTTIYSLIIATLFATAECFIASTAANVVPTPATSSPTESGSALNGHSTKNRKKQPTTKKKKKTRSTATRRTYTVRGNPSVTRKVASALLVEKLPELAALVGLEGEVEAPATDENVTAGAPADVAAPPSDIPSANFTAVAGVTGGYDDSELSDAEDDAVSAEDLEMLEEEMAELEIDDFYREFTDYMAVLYGEGESNVTDNGIDKVVAMETLVDWLGTRYLFGGMSRNGIDCSAFTRTMYGSLGCQIPRTAAAQWDAGDEEIEYDELQFGDLVFFNTRSAVYVSHVGIYLGEGMFAHASSRNGVTVSSLESNYYSTHYIGARRYDVTAADVETAAAEIDDRPAPQSPPTLRVASSVTTQ